MYDSLKKFIRKFWWWNLVIDLFLVVIGLILRYHFYEPILGGGPDTYYLTPSILVLLLTILHALFLLYFFIKGLVRRKWQIAVLLAVHIILLGMLILSLGFTILLFIGFSGPG